MAYGINRFLRVIRSKMWAKDKPGDIQGSEKLMKIVPYRKYFSFSVIQIIFPSSHCRVCSVFYKDTCILRCKLYVNRADRTAIFDETRFIRQICNYFCKYSGIFSMSYCNESDRNFYSA